MPKVIYYFKSFKSFSKKEDEAKGFIKSSTKDLTGLFFILEKYDNIIEEEFISNAYIKEYSFYEDEEEVLFFPFFN